MGRIALRACALLLLGLAVRAAHAASIQLEPSATSVPVDSLLTVQVYGTDFPLGADGGDFTLGWSSNLAYVGFEVANPPWDVSAFDDSAADFGYLGFVDVFSTTDTPGAGGVPFAIATLTLEALDEGPALVSVGASLVGWSLGGDTVDTDYGPDAEVEVTPESAPEPSALALIACACGALFRRGSSRSARD